MRYQWFKKQLTFFIRLTVSAFLIYFLLRRVDTRSLWKILLSAEWRLFAVALVFSFGKQAIEFYRLFLLFKVKGIDIHVWSGFKVMMTGTFLGTVSPTSLGTEIFRAYGFSRHTDNAADAISAVAINRFIGLTSLMMLATFSCLWQPEYARSIGLVWILLIFTLPVVLIALGFSKKLRHLLENKLFEKFDFITKTLAWLKNVGRSFYEYRTHGGMLVFIFLLSVLFQSVRVVVTYLLALALGVHIPLSYFFIMTPIVLLFTTLPLSVGGIGVREGGTVYFLSKIGIGQTEAFSVSIMWFIMALTSSIPGLFFYLIEGFGGKRGRNKDVEETPDEK